MLFFLLLLTRGQQYTADRSVTGMRKVYGAAILFAVLTVTAALAAPPPNISIRVSGKWTLKIDAANLAGGAGSDLLDAYETAVDAISISITKVGGNWRLDIKRVDTLWPAAVGVYALRTSGGSGSGTITGGDSSYQPVTTTDAYFFQGSLDRSGIGVQLKVDGVSVAIPADDYATTIYYTVTDI